MVGITRAPSTSRGTGRGVGAVVVDVGPDQHQALRHAERKAQTYGKALVGLASLLCLSVCASLASSALTILVFNESRTRGAIQPALSGSKPAAPPVGTGLIPYGTGLTGTLKVGPAVKTIGTSAFANTKLTYLDLSEATSLVEIGESAFSETNLAGTLVIPKTVTTIGNAAFYYTNLAGLDLSKATSLVEIGESAFSETNLAVIPFPDIPW